VITPSDPSARGAQLSLRFAHAEPVLEGLAARGVVADFRAPDIIRVAPVPLYNTYHEAWRFASILKELLANTVSS
jgi:kynureninase